MLTNHSTINDITPLMFAAPCPGCDDTGWKWIFCYETGRDLIPCDDCGEVA